MEPLETQATKDTANTGGPARALIFYQNWAEIISFTSAGLVHWLCGTCLSICFEFLCLWGQDCQSLFTKPFMKWGSSPAWELLEYGSSSQAASRPVCLPSSHPRLYKVVSNLSAQTFPELYLVVQQTYPLFSAGSCRKLWAEDAKGRKAHFQRMLVQNESWHTQPVPGHTQHRCEYCDQTR